MIKTVCMNSAASAKNNSLNYLDVAFEVKQFNDDDDEFFFFEGLASTFGNLDLVDDIVERGAFVDSIAAKTPVVLWQHRSDSPLGMPIEIRETDEGLFMKARLPKADTFVAGRVIPQIRVGSIRSMSIGFRILESEMDQDGVRLLQKVDLMEVSLVTFPANPMAAVTGFKTVTPYQDLPLAPRGRTWDASAARGRVRNATDSVESPSKEYRNAFLWYDSEDADNFGAYSLPFVDVVDGELMAIPRALNNAKARLDQTDIPDADKTRVLANIDRYQAKLEEEQPKSIYNVEAVKAFKKRDLEKALRESGSFSRDASMLIAKNVFDGQAEPDDDDDFTGQSESVGDGVQELLGKVDKHLESSLLSTIHSKVNNHARSFGDQATYR